MCKIVRMTNNELTPFPAAQQEIAEDPVVLVGEVHDPIDIADIDPFTGHDSPESFSAALEANPPSRVFSYCADTLFSTEQWAGFVAPDGTAHTFSATLREQADADRLRNTIWAAISRTGTPEVDGMVIRGAEPGEIHQRFESEGDSPKDHEKQAGNWARAVEEAHAAEPGYIQYLTDDNGVTIVDFTQGNMHLVTALYASAGQDINTVAALLPGIRLQDNTAIASWIGVVKL